MERLERGQNDGWRLIKRGDDLRRMVWIGAEGEVDASALERVFGCWHSDLLPLDRVCRSNGKIELYSAPFLSPLDVVPSQVATRACDLLRLAHDCLLSAADLRAVADPIGRPQVVPPPELWAAGREPSNSAPQGPPGLVHPGLRYLWRNDLREVAAHALSAAGVGPHAVVFYGDDGVGKSRLLDLIGFDAGWRGMRVARHVPSDLAASRQPLVLLLDDLTPEPGDGIARAAAVAERLNRALVVFATAGPEFSTTQLPGLTVDGVALTPWSPAELRAALVPAPADADGEWLVTAGRCGGSPRTLRLMLTVARGTGTGAPHTTVEALLAGLGDEARHSLYALSLLPKGAEPARLAAIAAVAPPWGELHPLIRLVGARVQSAVPIEPHQLRLADVVAAPIRARTAAYLTAPGEAGHRARLLATGGDLGAAVATLTPELAAAEPRAALAVLAELERCGLQLPAGVRARQAEICVTIGDREGALTILGTLIADGGLDADTHRLRRAELLEEAGDYAGAEHELESLPTQPVAGPTGLRVRADYLAGRLAEAGGNLERARRSYQAGLAATADDGWRAVGLTALGRLHLHLADGRGRGDRMLAEARDLFSRTGSRKGVAEVCRLQADAVLGFGDSARAGELLQQALEASLADDDRVGAAEAQAGLARRAATVGRLAAADRHLTLALGYLGGLDQAPLRRRLELDRAAVLIDLGRPQAAEIVLGPIRHRVAAGRPDPAVAGRIGLLSGLAALAAGDLDRAERELIEAMALSRGLAGGVVESQCGLALGWCHLDRRDPEASLRAAEAGLRALVPVSCGPTVTVLKVVVAHAQLEISGPAKAARFIDELTPNLDAAEPSLLAEVLALRAVVAARGGDVVTAGHGFAQAIEAAERQERPDVLARVIAAALKNHGDGLDGPRTWALLDRLRDLHRAADRRARLAILGVPAALHASPSPAVLAGEALGQLDATLRRLPAPGQRELSEVLEILGRKVPFTRAALVGDPDGTGLAVIAAARSIAVAADGQGEALGLAVVLGEAARLTGCTRAWARLAAETPFARHPETIAWGLGPALVAVSRGGLVLYLDRVRSLPPFADEEVRFAEAFVERIALESERGMAKAKHLPERQEEGGEADDLGLIGMSSAMARVRRDLRRLARFDIPVFVHGESGTGKELAASALHRLSRRAAGPFVPLNCAAMTETLIESELFGYVKGAFSGAVGDRDGLLARASGGTLFLDEIAELSPAFQAKLLRVVELGEYRPVGATTERRTDVRIVCATNRDMDEEVRAGRFREDLFYRLLSTATVEMPPLRERAGDVAVLIARFARRTAESHDIPVIRLSQPALSALERYPFPGNVRELERLVCGLVARCGTGVVEPDDLPVKVRNERQVLGTFERAQFGFEQRFVRALLEQHGGNRTHAAVTAGIARQTLVKMIAKLGLADGKGGAGGAERSPRPAAGSAFRVRSSPPRSEAATAEERDAPGPGLNP